VFVAVLAAAAAAAAVGDVGLEVRRRRDGQRRSGW